MKLITLKVGPLRLSVGRLFSGGLCPLNVIGCKWSMLPRLSEQQQKDSEQGELDVSPAATGNALLAGLRRLLGRQRKP